MGVKTVDRLADALQDVVNEAIVPLKDEITQLSQAVLTLSEQVARARRELGNLKETTLEGLRQLGSHLP